MVTMFVGNENDVDLSQINIQRFHVVQKDIFFGPSVKENGLFEPLDDRRESPVGRRAFRGRDIVVKNSQGREGLFRGGLPPAAE